MANSRSLIRIFGLLALLMVSWLLWSGIYKPILLGLGVFSCLLVIYLSNRINFFRAETGLRLLPWLPPYWIWLLIEIFKSSFDVARIILSPKMPISPTVITIDAAQEGQVGQAILGNSITLSPGTVTLDIYQGRLTVHCLTEAGAQDLLAGEANRRLARITES